MYIRSILESFANAYSNNWLLDCQLIRFAAWVYYTDRSKFLSIIAFKMFLLRFYGVFDYFLYSFVMYSYYEFLAMDFYFYSDILNRRISNNVG